MRGKMYKLKTCIG